MSDLEKKKKELFDPILDLFGANDGGVAYTKLFHAHWENFVEFAQDSSNPQQEQAKQAIASFTHVSRICKSILASK